MSSFMKKIFTILLIGCFISCSNNINEEPLAIDMLGEYEVVSAITNQAIDGNFDGAYSNNFLS